MFFLGFCLLAVVSGWIAWRNNPLFSTRSTLRFLLAVGLMLIVVIFAIIQATRFTEHHSQTAGFTMMGAVVLFGAISMIWVIVLVSTPKSVPLPASTKMLYPYRRRVSTYAARGGWIGLAWTVLTIVLHGTARFVLGSLGGFFVFLGLVLWFTAYITARHADRCLSAVASQPWLHWTYTPDQWQQWIATEVARTPTVLTFVLRRDWHKVAWPMLSIAASVFIFAPGSLFYRAAYILGIVLLLVLLIVAGQHNDKAASQRVFATLSKAAPEAYFGEEGIFAEGEFTPWLTVGVFILSASMDNREPRSLILSFSKSTANQISTVDLALPLPTGEAIAADLATLQQRLSARCPTATVRLV